MAVRRVGIVANTAKEEAPEFTVNLELWLKSRGVDVLLHREISALLNKSGGFDFEDLGKNCDLIVVFGGDGTILRAARGICKFAVPLLGVNLGGFGYLTEVNLSEMTEAMELIIRGEHVIERRMMLDVVLERNGRTVKEQTVLNDAVINRGNLSRIVHLETFINGRCLTIYKADGIIVSTPTGSTAYSLSAGGPIVFPEHESIIINPICPHTLTNRPIIVSPDAEVRVVLWTKGEGATLTFDGQESVDLQSGDVMKVKKSPYYTKLVCSPHRDYLEILRTKLGWGGLPTGLRRS